MPQKKLPMIIEECNADLERTEAKKTQGTAQSIGLTPYP